MFSDEGKISQILRNFISNALKFTERGEVRVSATRVGDDALFSVADTGIGIAPEDLERIFQDFAQVDHPIQRRVKGTGLGLPLSKKLAGLLGGEVRVQSQVGTGSVFTARIPLRYEERVRLNQTSETAIAAVVADPARVPILVVEDQLEMMMMYRSYMKNSGFDMIFAQTIRQAQEVLERLRPRAVILDVVLRSEDSWRFLADFKRDPHTQDIPVIVASTIEDQGKAFHLGADRYLLKPVERAQLLENLRALTGTGPLPRILIIDDEERDRYLLKQQLGESAFIVKEVSNGSDGIRAAARDKPNAIILDLTMPGMTGFEVLDALKANAATRDIPVIISTSRVLAEREKLQLEEGTFAILSKNEEVSQRIAGIVRQAVNSSGIRSSVMSRSAC